MQRLADGEPNRMPLGLLQFTGGTIIFLLNFTLLSVTLSSRKLRTAFYYLSANLWFANCLLGMTTAIANMVDREQPMALVRAEGTVALLNCLATLATLVALNTARILWSRHSRLPRMSPWSALKVIVCIWATILALVFAKTLAFAIYQLRQDSSICYACVFGFEGAVLLIFALVAAALYLWSLYAVSARRGSAIHARVPPAAVTDMANEHRDTVTSGLWHAAFLGSFVVLGALLVDATLTADAAGGLRQSPLADQASLLLYTLHAFVNPLLLLARDPDARAAACQLLMCGRAPPRQPPEHELVALEQPVEAQLGRRPSDPNLDL